MMKNILYTVAKDSNGKLIKANDAEKNDYFFCPVCNSELILRKSGKTGKNTKRPHFAHKMLTPNCTPETALHFSFKTLLAQKIEALLESKNPLTITWQCSFCKEHHSDDLLKKINSVVLEHDLKIARPDIALLDHDNKTSVVIEIIVTHKPEVKVLDFYKANNIIVVQINLTSHNDLDELENKITNPDNVSTCFNPVCGKCGHFQHKKRMLIIDGPCWQCASVMKIAAIENDNTGPSSFSKEELEFARSKGVIIKEHYSNTVKEKYLANTCPECGTFIGDHYLFTDFIAPSSYGEFSSEIFDIGFYCIHCNDSQFYDTDIKELD